VRSARQGRSPLPGRRPPRRNAPGVVGGEGRRTRRRPELCRTDCGASGGATATASRCRPRLSGDSASRPARKPRPRSSVRRTAELCRQAGRAAGHLSGARSAANLSAAAKLPLAYDVVLYVDAIFHEAEFRATFAPSTREVGGEESSRSDEFRRPEAAPGSHSPHEEEELEVSRDHHGGGDGIRVIDPPTPAPAPGDLSLSLSLSLSTA
jgi:hypothetical protein